MFAPTGRTEKRNHQAVALELRPLTQSDGITSATTENVSAHGARVVTANPLQPSSYLAVRKPGTESRLGARVIYCYPIGTARFAVGLRFREDVGDYWPPSAEQRLFHPGGDSGVRA